MASQRHKRENDFFRQVHPDSATPGDPTGPIAPRDSSLEEASDYDEVPAWPDDTRPGVVPG